MADDTIFALYPPAPDALTDVELLTLYATVDREAPLVRANFITSIDGSATAAGLSGGLGAPADKRVFDLLRQLCDVVLVGAGTVRSEGYGAMRLAPDAARWRLAHGLPEHPVFALVSGRLDLDPTSDVFAKAPVRPLVLTSAAAPAAARAALSRVADVVDCGETTVSASHLVSALVARGLRQIHCEGGPSLLGTLIAADLLDELCLTTSPTLEGGAGPRIVRAPGGAAAPAPRAGAAEPPAPLPLRAMRLVHLLRSGDLTLARYARAR